MSLAGSGQRRGLSEQKHIGKIFKVNSDGRSHKTERTVSDFPRKRYPCASSGKKGRRGKAFFSQFRKKAKGSYTVEAALILPLFLWAGITVLYFFRVTQVEWGVQTAIHEVARDLSISGVKAKPFNAFTVAGLCDAKIIAEDVPVGYIFGGIAGITYNGTEVNDHEIKIEASYFMNVPFSSFARNIFGLKICHVRQRAYARRWTGYDPEETGENEDEVYVYVTETGHDWHRSLDCSYLNPSIRSVTLEGAGSERNESGGKYYECSACAGSGYHGIYYITDYGNRYHTRLDCPKLKRTIRRIKLSEAKEKYKQCPKCGREGG